MRVIFLFVVLALFGCEDSTQSTGDGDDGAPDTGSSASDAMRPGPDASGANLDASGLDLDAGGLDLDAVVSPGTMIWLDVPAGRFTMGCSVADDTCFDGERPAHEVSVAAFQMTRTEITQAQFEAAMGYNPSVVTRCDDCPVDSVTWYEADDFCRTIGARLPAESEWEYAARAGGTSRHGCGDDEACLDDVAWHVGNAENTTHPVAQKRGNDFGFYDMLGNVWEWTEDCWHSDYVGAPGEGGVWAGGDCGYRVVRGGSWGLGARGLRVSNRDADYPDSYLLPPPGMRCAQTPGEAPDEDAGVPDAGVPADGGDVPVDGAFDGYTLFSPLGSQDTFLMDIHNRVVHRWAHDCSGPSATTPYLLNDGSILRTCAVGDASMRGGGVGGRVQRVGWDGEVVWDYIYSDANHQLHHDIEPMPNGNILMVAWERKVAEETTAAGREDGVELWPTHIIEVQPVGRDGGEIVWRWHAWDHLVQSAAPSKPNFGVVADHPELFDLNLGGERGGDWIHANGLDYNPELDQIVFSSHSLDEFYVIDHSTTTEEAASHAGGRSGKGGDLLYRWGNPANYGAPGARHFFVLHGVNWIDEGLPGAGNILVFNNGDRPGEVDDWSVVEEVVTPVDAQGRYALDVGGAYGPDAPVWTFSAPGEFYSNHLAGAFRLPNGNTLAIEATSAHLIEVTPEGEQVWDYTYGSGRDAIAKAMRYAPDHPGLAAVEPAVGCEVDDECGEDLRCEAGGCVPVAVAECEQDPDCGAAQSCVAGACVEGLGGPCAGPSDCPVALVCSPAGLCAVPLTRCAEDAECAEDERCELRTHVCRTVCDADGDCDGGMICVRNICLPPLP